MYPDYGVMKHLTVFLGSHLTGLCAGGLNAPLRSREKFLDVFDADGGLGRVLVIRTVVIQMGNDQQGPARCNPACDMTIKLQLRHRRVSIAGDHQIPLSRWFPRREVGVYPFNGQKSGLFIVAGHIQCCFGNICAGDAPTVRGEPPRFGTASAAGVQCRTRCQVTGFILNMRMRGGRRVVVFGAFLPVVLPEFLVKLCLVVMVHYASLLVVVVSAVSASAKTSVVLMVMATRAPLAAASLIWWAGLTTFPAAHTPGTVVCPEASACTTVPTGLVAVSRCSPVRPSRLASTWVGKATTSTGTLRPSASRTPVSLSSAISSPVTCSSTTGMLSAASLASSSAPKSSPLVMNLTRVLH